MAVEAVARCSWAGSTTAPGRSILLVVPVLVAAGPRAGARARPWRVVVVGVVVWGFAHGVQDSTIKAAVADLVEAPRRATAYGVFAGIQGLLAIVGGAGAGWLYERSLTALVVVGRDQPGWWRWCCCCRRSGGQHAGREQR